MREKTSDRNSKYLIHYLKSKQKREAVDYLPTLQTLEEEYIGYVLELSGFDLVKSSRILDISPTSLIKKLRHLEIRL